MNTVEAGEARNDGLVTGQGLEPTRDAIKRGGTICGHVWCAREGDQHEQDGATIATTVAGQININSN